MWRIMVLAVLFAPLAGAQIAVPALQGLPGVNVPGMPHMGLPRLQRLTPALSRTLSSHIRTLEQARKRHILKLLRRYPRLLALDRAGNPIVRGEILALAPSAAALRRARAAGLSLLRTQRLAGLGLRVVVLRTPPGQSAAFALATLRRLDPQGTYDFNHIYTDSGTVRAVAVRPIAAPAGRSGASPADPRPVLGLIDGGVDLAQPVFRDATIHQHGCGGKSVPSAHGTAVASLMVGQGGHFAGAAPGAELYADNVFCARPTGGSVTAIARAFAWLVRRGVPVINVSLVGPANALLHAVVRRVLSRGTLIVAAVGNDGPAAPALYPAAYPGVIGVTAVGLHRRVLFEAERGPQVMFAAPGADIEAARIPSGYAPVRGTSFAAPLVAGLLAPRLRVPSPLAAHAALESLIQRAIHLGGPGRNPVYGYGLLAAGLPHFQPRKKNWGDGE